jgi:hypothetical protein
MSAVFCNLTDLGTTPVLLCGVRRRLGQGCGPKLRQVLTHRQPGYASVRWIAVCTFLPNAPGQAKAYTPRAYEAERPCCAGCVFLLWPCETVNSVSMKLIGLDVHTNTK